VNDASVTFPGELLPALESALHTLIFDIHPLSGGTQKHTFLAGTSDGFWVVRVDAAPGERLQRAVAAQQQAQMLGFPTPAIAAHDRTTISAGVNAGDYSWSVEEFVQGVEFDPPGFDPTMRPVIGRDVGEQLRKLHAFAMPKFGLLPPNAADQSPTIATWLANRRARLESALPLVLNAPNLPHRFNEAFALLHTYTGTPRLCHGDFAGTNVLVNETRLVAAVDWEWACGGDPALDFAWWYFWHDDQTTLDAMIEGYAPEESPLFTQRVFAYALLHALDTLLIYQEEANHKGARYCQEKLQQYSR